MDLTLILGPMKSGKSYDLISFFAPLKYTTIPFVLYQSARHVRDEHVRSRNGVFLEARRVLDLKDALTEKYDVVGIDETHMFAKDDIKIIEELLKNKTRVIVSGLDLDYRGKMFPLIQDLFELGPKEVRYRRAVCELCKTPEAVYTQVFNQGIPVTTGMPSVIPDDGTFTYQAVCRHCFVKV
jgi:thymidine kinase